jgi:Protein of unknown function (DUF2845)
MKWVWFAMLLAATPAPANAMRCGSDLVTEGQYMYEVLERCGEPVEQHLVTQYLDTRGRYIAAWPFIVEAWIYNLGPTRLQRRLLFQDGQLFQIDTLDRGIVVEGGQ